MMPKKKKRLQDFYDIFSFARVRDKMTKIAWNVLQKSVFRTRRVRYTSRRQVLDYAENVGALR